jgi:hypothetical protein
MNERELIANFLKRRPEAKNALDYLDEAIFNAVEEIGDAADDPVGYLVREFDRMRAAFPGAKDRSMPEGGGGPLSGAIGDLKEHEWERIAVRAKALAKHAAADQSVLAFRNRFTGGSPLSQQRAEAFAESPAAANLPTTWFEENGVPVVDHSARVLSVEFKGRSEIVEFRIDPPGTTFRVERGSNMPEYEELLIAGGLRFKEPGVTVLVRSGSPLDELRKVGRRLSELGLSWKDNYATRFILTGEPPPEEYPIGVESGPGGTIILHVTPWVSPDSVKGAYRHALYALWLRGWMSSRYSYLGPTVRKPSARKVKSVRRISDKNLKLLSFITDRIDYRGNRPEGKDVAAVWDAKYPEWAYRGDTRTMWRDYNRALKQVAPEVANS